MILSPFNLLWFGIIALTVAGIFVLWWVTKKLPEQKKAYVLSALCALNVIVFFVYKLFLSKDADYMVITGKGTFNWFDELPLHLCNINMFLIPLGVLTKRRPVMGFAFFIAPLGAFFALLSPALGFAGYSIFLPRMLGYYLTHVLIIICGVSLCTLGFYRPKLKDFPGVFITFFVLAFGIFLVNILLRATVCPYANYFYTFEDSNAILKLFYSWIPVDFLYLMPALVILAVYMFLVLLFFSIPKLLKKKKEEKKEA